MSIEVKEAPATPTEVLIPEARRHQRGRYVRLGIVLAVVALLIASLVASAIVLFGRAAGGKTGPRASAAALSSAVSHVYFRPALCTAPPYVAASQNSPTSGSPMCSAASLLSHQNLNIDPLRPQEAGSSPNGFTSANVPPDSTLTSVPSTSRSADRPSATVLLPALANNCYAKGYRCVLGPAEMTGSSIQSAAAEHIQTGQWVVDYRTTPRGGPLWDKVANENFHQELAIEVNGFVYSAPLIQPGQSSFSSFGGRGEVGGLTKAQAIHLAQAMNPHVR